MNTKLKTVGLFAGIGGIELGLERTGHETKLLCEIDRAANAVLRQRFPGVALHDDVTTLEALPAGVDLLAAGFPCQDLSQAGNTAGIGGSRSGLVNEVFRLLKSERVPLVLIENVPFMLQLNKGQAMEVVVSKLEELGYKWAYRVMNSRAFGVPQRRERVYLIASLDRDPREILLSGETNPEEFSGNWRERACGFYWTEGIRGLGWAIDSIPTLKGGSTIGIPSQPAIILPDGRVGKPNIRDAERLQGFEENWTEPAESVAKKGARWKLVGNAVTVNAAAWIGAKLCKPVAYNDGFDSPLKRKAAWPRAAWNVGGGRFVSDASAFPTRENCSGLLRFLRYPLEPLSARATRGFLDRTKVSSLRFPAGFLEILEEHLRVVELSAAA